MTRSFILLLISCSFFFCSCTHHIFRSGDNEYTPEIEVQVNNTSEQTDDYVNLNGTVACRARIMNYRDVVNGNHLFAGGVRVQLKNYSGIHGGQLNFSLTSGGTYQQTLPGGAVGASSVVLPEDGGWFNFYIKGTANSSIDKDAVIEVKENRAANTDIVLARKSLEVAAAPSNPSQHLEIMINATSTIDDYLTWSPIQCAVRYVNAPSGSGDINVVIQNLSGSGDKLRFAADGTITPLVSTAAQTNIHIAVPGSGSWVYFYAAGTFANAANENSPCNAALPVANKNRGSVWDKDAVMEIVTDNAAHTVLCREGAMVRIRKNANFLTAEEKTRYISAVYKLNETYNKYASFFNAHRAHEVGLYDRFEMHSRFVLNDDPDHAVPVYNNSSFLPWHRAFLVHFERNLQAVDPSVTVPYWKYDKPAPNLFATDFMGFTPGASVNATFNASDDLNTWPDPETAASSGIPRQPRYDQAASSPAGPFLVSGGGAADDECTTLATGNLFVQLSNPFEKNSHGPAHFKTGQTGSWINDFDLSVKDPLFFLIHSNIDRLWARWQWLNDKFDATDISAYDLQGTFPTTAPWSTRRTGEYSEETMWPWNGVTGPGVSGDWLSNRPATAPLPALPATTGYVFFTQPKPKVKDMVDYKSSRYITTAPTPGYNFAYDDTPFQ